MTDIYWPHDPDNTTYPEHESPKRSQQKLVLKSTNPKTAKFNILLHGIRKRKPRYYFKCKEPGCTYSFATLKGWNLHHCLHHKNLFTCKNCNKKLVTPSAHQVHQNQHASLKYICKTFGTMYPYMSTLRMHRRVHTSQ